MKPAKMCALMTYAFVSVGHRLEVLNFLTKKNRRGDGGEKRGREEKKEMYQIHYVHKTKKEKHQMK